MVGENTTYCYSVTTYIASFCSREHNGCMIPNLKNARVKKGLKQKELAVLLNVSSKTVSNYELGFRDPDIKTLIKISQILNVTIDYLVGLEQKTLIEQIKERVQNLDKEELAGLLGDYIEFIAKIK